MCSTMISMLLSNKDGSIISTNESSLLLLWKVKIPEIFTITSLRGSRDVSALYTDWETFEWRTIPMGLLEFKKCFMIFGDERTCQVHFRHLVACATATATKRCSIDIEYKFRNEGVDPNQIYYGGLYKRLVSLLLTVTYKTSSNSCQGKICTAVKSGFFCHLWRFQHFGSIIKDRNQSNKSRRSNLFNILDGRACDSEIMYAASCFSTKASICWWWYLWIWM